MKCVAIMINLPRLIYYYYWIFKTNKFKDPDISLRQIDNNWTRALNEGQYRTHRKYKSFRDLTKNKISFNKEYFQAEDLPSNKYRTISTGGSSGEPATIPLSKLLAWNNWSASYHYRSSFGYKIGDRFAMCWGHSHLMTNATRAAKYRRSLSDALNNAKRFNAYDTSQQNLDDTIIELVKFQPKVIMGYASFLQQLAKATEKKWGTEKVFRNLKFVISTSEVLSSDMKRQIERSLNAPVVQEYGSAETGIIAYDYAGLSDLQINSRNYLVQYESDQLLVSSLQQGGHPLFRYSLDDEVLVAKRIDNICKSISAIKGRPVKSYQLYSNNIAHHISGIAIVHASKSIKGVLKIQIGQNTNCIDVFLVTHNTLDASVVKKEIVHNLKTRHPWFSSDFIKVNLLEQTKKTLSGKSPTYL